MKLTYIAVRSNTELWGIDNEYRIYHYSNNQWKQVPGELEQIAVSPSGDVWGVGLDKRAAEWNVLHYDPNANSWIPETGAISQLTLGMNGLIWGVNYRAEVWSRSYDNGIWGQSTTGIRQISGSNPVGLYGVNYAGDILHYNTGVGWLSWSQLPGGAKYIAIGGTEFWGVNFMGEISRYQYPTNTWQSIANLPGKLQQLAISTTGDVWALTREGLLYRYTNNAWQYMDIASVNDNKHYQALTDSIKTYKQQALPNASPAFLAPSPRYSLQAVQAWRDALPAFTADVQKSIKQEMARQLQSIEPITSLKLDVDVLKRALQVAKDADKGAILTQAQKVLSQHAGQFKQAQTALATLAPAGLGQIVNQLEQTVTSLNSLETIKQLPQQLTTLVDSAKALDFAGISNAAVGLFGKINTAAQQANTEFNKVSDLAQQVANLLKAPTLDIQQLANKKLELKAAQTAYDNLAADLSKTFETFQSGVEVVGMLAGFAGNPELGHKIVAVGQAAVTIGTNVVALMAGGAVLGPVGAIAGAAAGLLSALGVFGGGGPSAEQQMLQGISEQISQFAEHVDNRFNRIEEMLKLINEQIDNRFDRLEDMLIANNQQMNLRFDRIETMMIEQFREVKGDVTVLNAKVDAIRQQLDSMRQLLDQGLTSLSLQPYLTLKVKIEDIKNYPNPEDRQRNAIDYATALKDILRNHINNAVLAGALQVLTAQALVDEVNNRGLVRSVNYLAAYAAQFDTRIAAVKLVNPALWREVTTTYQNLIKQAPHLFTITWDNNNALMQEFMTEGDKVQTFTRSVQTSEQLFKQLIQNYRDTLTTTLANLMNAGTLSAEALALAVKNVDTARSILAIYSSLAFPSDNMQYQDLHRYLQTELWDGKAVSNFFQTATASKALTMTGIKEDGLKLLAEFESRILAKIESAKAIPAPNVHLVRVNSELKLMAELDVGRVAPAPNHTDTPITPTSSYPHVTSSANRLSSPIAGMLAGAKRLMLGNTEEASYNEALVCLGCEEEAAAKQPETTMDVSINFWPLLDNLPGQLGLVLMAKHLWQSWTGANAKPAAQAEQERSQLANNPFAQLYYQHIEGLDAILDHEEDVKLALETAGDEVVHQLLNLSQFLAKPKASLQTAWAELPKDMQAALESWAEANARYVTAYRADLASEVAPAQQVATTKVYAPQSRTLFWQPRTLSNATQLLTLAETATSHELPRLSQ